jgi:hypothetical protein
MNAVSLRRTPSNVVDPGARYGPGGPVTRSPEFETINGVAARGDWSSAQDRWDTKYDNEN